MWDVPIVLNRARKPERVHTTQKPLFLMEQLVHLFSNEGETVLDATAGSGTTGIAAAKHGRKAVLIEQSKAYCEVIAKRVNELQTPLDVFGGVA